MYSSDYWSDLALLNFAIALLGDEYFENFPFVVNSPPKIVSFAVDAYENLIQMPPSLRETVHRC